MQGVLPSVGVSWQLAACSLSQQAVRGANAAWNNNIASKMKAKIHKMHNRIRVPGENILILMATGILDGTILVLRIGIRARILPGTRGNALMWNTVIVR